MQGNKQRKSSPSKRYDVHKAGAAITGSCDDIRLMKPLGEGVGSQYSSASLFTFPFNLSNCTLVIFHPAKTDLKFGLLLSLFNVERARGALKRE